MSQTPTHLFRLLLLLLALPFFAAAQKSLTAVRNTQKITVDGRLDDAAWQTAPAATDFIKNFPSFGGPSSQKTIVKILYDDDAVYIGAHLYDDPKLVRRQLTARDRYAYQDVDYFGVQFDTYLDKQNGFSFTVTAANVQGDAKLGQNNGDGDEDPTWDAVWESRVSMAGDGWTVEIKIPYLSLRFAKKETQDWGLQFRRHIRRDNETSYWNATDPKVDGLVNQFGIFKALTNLQPPLRLSLSPYLSTGVRRSPAADEGYNTEWLKSGGMDVKWGVNESFTVDATLVPDFGQVVSDNVVNNLSPFEVQFTENRPFFTEGTELFDKAGLFYSRRIGATPSGYYDVYNGLAGDEEVIRNPSVTRLYNAIKFSGRTKNKLGIGVFNAVAAPMRATIRRKNGDEYRLATSALTNYNIVVLDQAFKDRSSITFTNTNVLRAGSAPDANVSALSFSKFNKKNIYALSGNLAYSHITGAYQHNGYSAYLKAEKVSGRFQASQSVNIESDRYDPNDLGYLRSPNVVNFSTSALYSRFQPTKHFQSWHAHLNSELSYLYKPNVFNFWELNAGAFLLFKNFWDLSVSVGGQPVPQHDYFELRKSDSLLRRFAYYFLSVNGSTDSRKKLYVGYNFVFANGTLDRDSYHEIGLTPRYRFSNKFTASLGLQVEHDDKQLGYAYSNAAGASVVGFRTSTTVAPIFSAIYNFTPWMNLTIRSRHYWNKIHYLDFFTANSKGLLLPYPFRDGQDDNFNAFNHDVFFTWDFRLGSRIIAGWKNWLGDDGIDGVQYSNFSKNFSRVFSERHGNEVTVKFIYFIDYNSLRKRRGAVDTGNNK